MAKAKSKAEIREQTGQNQIFGALQNLGQTFMLPISILPIAGLLLGIGSSFTNPQTIEMYNLGHILYEGSALYGILSVLRDSGDIIFSHLGLLFGISVASGLAKREEGVASLSAIIAYFVMYASMTSTLHNFRDVEALSQTPGLISNYLGFENTMNLGVLGGILIGLVVAYLHNKYNRIELPEAISFFSGTHFIPIISSLAAILIGVIMAFVWPFISGALSGLGGFISGLGIFGLFLYAYIYRALIPFGLHHVFYLPFWQTAVGGTAVVNGETVVGAQNIVFAQLAAGEAIDPHAAAHFSFMFPVMLFGIPAASLAMYRAARPERKDDVKGFYLSSSLTSFLTGITEPIEFAMLFASPVLYYAIHCVLFALSAVAVYLLGAGVPVTFSGGVIDFILYGILPGNAQTNWVSVVIVGVIMAVLYYVIFKYGMKRFDWPVPGNEKEPVAEEIVIEDAAYEDLSEDEQRAYRIVAGLGGTDNLKTYRNCATRLRVEVEDGDLVNEGLLQGTGSAATVVNGQNVQVVYGTTVPNVKASIDALIHDGHAPKTSEAITADSLEAEAEPAADSNENQNQADKKEKVTYASERVYAPASGQLIALDQVDDPVFSTGIMGEGYVIQPTDNQILAPVSGEVVMVMDSKHAIGFMTDTGLEVLIHMGIDTVALDGAGFDLKVSQGDQVQAGDEICLMDLEAIKEAGKATDIMVVYTNTADKLHENQIQADAKVTAGQEVGQVLLK